MSLVANDSSPPFADPPNSLLVQSIGLDSAKASAWALGGLILLCMVPRTLWCFQLGTFCPDGSFFIGTATALEQGHWREAFAWYPLNLYPIILGALHHLGLEWAVAAKVWGVGISSLTVLPLFGWVRRQFDLRIAWIACGLYALHPNLIRWSPEPIRCPTFWFLLVLSIYLLWRAATERRLAIYALAGLSMIAASCTRIEGLLLLIPLVCWSGSVFHASRTDFWRLALGPVFAVGLLLTLFLAVGFFPPLTQFRWGVVHPVHRDILGHCLKFFAGKGNELAFPAPLEEMLWNGARKFATGVDMVQGLLMLGGAWAWRRIVWRNDQRPLIVASLAVMAGVGVHLLDVGQTADRYFVPIVLLGMPFAARGLLGLMKWAQDAFALRLMPITPQSAMILLLAAVSILNLPRVFVDVRLFGHQTRIRWKDRTQSQPAVRIATLNGSSSRLALIS